ncbi:hypothetical protein [Sphingomonas sp.]
MSTVSDALTALKNVVLMQERLDAMRRELGEVHGQVGKLDDRLIDLDRRVVRIEALIEYTGRSGGGSPRLEQP